MPIYFIRSGQCGPVKIGIAKDVQTRLRGLQTGHHETLHLMRVVNGGSQEERWLHDHYRSNRLAGEWFNFSPDMLSIVPPQFPAKASQVARKAAAIKMKGSASDDFGQAAMLAVSEGICAVKRRHKISDGQFGAVVGRSGDRVYEWRRCASEMPLTCFVLATARWGSLFAKPALAVAGYELERLAPAFPRVTEAATQLRDRLAKVAR